MLGGRVRKVRASGKRMARVRLPGLQRRRVYSIMWIHCREYSAFRMTSNWLTEQSSERARPSRVHVLQGPADPGTLTLIGYGQPTARVGRAGVPCSW